MLISYKVPRAGNIVIILRKSRKNNYLKLKLYKLIALLSILKKILKKIIIKKLSDYVKENILLSSK